MYDMSPAQFVQQIITPTLAALGLDSPAAEQLLLGTALQESGLRNIQQIGGGPALGYFQMEPHTHDDIWTNFLAYKSALAAKVQALLPAGTAHGASQLIPCQAYACAMARILYYRVSAPLPPADDLNAQAAYYKKYYNTPGGAATPQEYISNWNRAMASV
jgi:hypothetical protein